MFKRVRGSEVLTAATLAWLTSVHASADVRLPAILSDHAVLQQNAQVAVWGWADAGESITVTPSWSGAAASTSAAADGRWKTVIRTGPAGGPHTLTVAGRNTVVVSDVLFGEVWLGSGQSNMEWAVASSLNAAEETAAALDPQIRMFTVQRASSSALRDDVTGKWEACSPQTVGRFSAVAYYFGRSLHQKLGVPVGLVASSWGGTEIEKWIPEPAMLSDAQFASAIEARRAALAEFDRVFTTWQKENDAADPGAAGHWESPTLDDRDWAALPAYKTWETADLVNFDGVAWFRGVFEAPDAWAGQGAVLELGAIDDEDRTYVNGTLVGSTSNWSTPRTYALPMAMLTPGTNSVVIRVHDTGGLGGFVPGAGQPCVKRGSETLAITSWKYHVGVAQSQLTPAPQPPAPQHSVLYNAMIAPLTPFTIRGVVWYQGESNVPRAVQYAHALPMLIHSWRQSWGVADLPFYYVQIAPFAGYTGWKLPEGTAAELREAQRLALAVPGTGMVVTTDLVADVQDIHPPNKQAVGARLALWALSQAYGDKSLTFSGPGYRRMVIEGSKIRLYFDHVGQGLDARGGTLTGFTIAGSDRRFVPAQAVIDGDTVVVHAPQVKKPVAVRFAWEDAPIPSFFNKDNLPASPFRTDDWPLQTAEARW